MDDLLEVRQSELKRHVESTLNLKRVPSLKRMCRSRGMRVGGRKADLVDRLVVDVLDKGWSIATDTDLWRDYSMVPDSPADRNLTFENYTQRMRACHNIVEVRVYLYAFLYATSTGSC